MPRERLERLRPQGLLLLLLLGLPRPAVAAPQDLGAPPAAAPRAPGDPWLAPVGLVLLVGLSLALGVGRHRASRGTARAERMHPPGRRAWLLLPGLFIGAAARPAAAAPRRPPDPCGWVTFHVRLWEVDQVWRFALLDLPGHEPASTSEWAYPTELAAYAAACALLTAAGYPVPLPFQRPGEPDAGRTTWGPVHYHRIATRRPGVRSPLLRKAVRHAVA